PFCSCSRTAFLDQIQLLCNAIDVVAICTRTVCRGIEPAVLDAAILPVCIVLQPFLTCAGDVCSRRIWPCHWTEQSLLYLWSSSISQLPTTALRQVCAFVSSHTSLQDATSSEKKSEFKRSESGMAQQLGAAIRAVPDNFRDLAIGYIHTC